MPATNQAWRNATNAADLQRRLDTATTRLREQMRARPPRVLGVRIVGRRFEWRDYCAYESGLLIEARNPAEIQQIAAALLQELELIRKPGARRKAAAA